MIKGHFIIQHGHMTFQSFGNIFRASVESKCVDWKRFRATFEIVSKTSIGFVFKSSIGNVSEGSLERQFETSLESVNLKRLLSQPSVSRRRRRRRRPAESREMIWIILNHRTKNRENISKFSLILQFSLSLSLSLSVSLIIPFSFFHCLLFQYLSYKLPIFSLFLSSFLLPKPTLLFLISFYTFYYFYFHSPSVHSVLSSSLSLSTLLSD